MTPGLKDLLWLLIEGSNYVVLLPIGVLLWRWGSLSKAQKYMGYLILLIGANQLLAKGISIFTEGSNLPLYHLYIFLEGLGLIAFYKYRFKHLAIDKYLKGGAVFLGVAIVINALFFQGIWMLPSFTRSLEAIIVLILTLYYFHIVSKEGTVKRLDQSFWFWTSAGLWLYFSSNLMLFMFTNFFTNRSDQLFLGVWSIHAVLNIILYIFYSIAFLCLDRESYSSS